jgi:hypothetical protein
MSGPTSEYARKLAAELFRKLPGRAQKVRVRQRDEEEGPTGSTSPHIPTDAR